jgi:hypothetical protein
MKYVDCLIEYWVFKKNVFTAGVGGLKYGRAGVQHC